MIAVMGDTSSGKSSLLSSISMIELPSATKLTTRCPIMLQMQNSKVRSAKVSKLAWREHSMQHLPWNVVLHLAQSHSFWKRERRGKSHSNPKLVMKRERGRQVFLCVSKLQNMTKNSKTTCRRNTYALDAVALEYRVSETDGAYPQCQRGQSQKAMAKESVVQQPLSSAFCIISGDKS